MITKTDPFSMLDLLLLDMTNNDYLKTDAKTTGNGYIFTLEIPGFSEKEIDIQITNNQLKIIANHESKDNLFRNSFQRTWSIPSDIDPDNIEALLKNGILTVKVLKKTITQSKKITIKTC